MINVINWHWPQWVQACLLFFALSCELVKHGQPKAPERYNFPKSFTYTAIAAAILVAGGFFA